MRGRACALVLAAGIASGCGDGQPPRTGVVVAIESEYAIPTELNGLRVIIRAPGTAGTGGRDSYFDLGDGPDQYRLPGRMAILPRAGVRSVHIEVQGRRDEMTVVSRSATLAFDPGRMVLLTLVLRRACLAQLGCPPGETCGEGGSCGPDFVEVSRLPSYVPSDLDPRWMADAGEGSSPPTSLGSPDGSAPGPMDASPQTDAWLATDTFPGAEVGRPADVGPGADALLPDAPPPAADGGTRPNGETCQTGAQCASGICADGVCCDLACEGKCEACDVSDRKGRCWPVTGAPHGSRGACLGQSGACAGSCDGMGRSSCAYPGMTVECAPARCAGDLATPRSVCDGAGACVGPAAVSCQGLGCNGDQCSGGCSASSPCPGDKHCQAGRCVAKVADGAPCTDPLQCQSGACVAGLCCDRGCGGACESCTLPGKQGKCSPLSGGSACRAAAGPCDSAETCDGTSGQCPADSRKGAGVACGPAPQACESQATCTGNSVDCPANGLKPSGTGCGSAAVCSGSSFTPAQTCNGTSPTCPTATATSCGPYACDAAGCKTTCSAPASGCASGFYCNTSGATPACQAVRADGLDCTSDGQCASGTCKTYHADLDGDGATSGTRTVCGATPPAAPAPGRYLAAASSSPDCCDSDARTRPGQTGFFSGANACGKCDFDCDGSVAHLPAHLDGYGCCGSGIKSSAGAECGVVVSLDVYEHGGCWYQDLGGDCAYSGQNGYTTQRQVKCGDPFSFQQCNSCSGNVEAYSGVVTCK